MQNWVIVVGFSVGNLWLYVHQHNPAVKQHPVVSLNVCFLRCYCSLIDSFVESMHISELLSLQRFSEYAGPHLIRGAKIHVDLSSILIILDQEIFGLKMLDSF
jgi:hypothetical protein